MIVKLTANKGSYHFTSPYSALHHAEFPLLILFENEEYYT